MATQSTLFPTLLLPVKIETRFVRNEEVGQLQLWLRIFPDAIFLDSFRRNLTPEEKADHKRFQAASPAETETTQEGQDDQQVVWRELVDKYGVYRAKWIIRPREYEEDAEAEETYTFGWLPTNFRIFLHFANGEIKPINTSIIPDRLPAFGDLDGITDEWISAFNTPDNRLDAVKAGMGAIIDLIELKDLNAQSAPQIDKVVVVGIHDAGDDDSTSSFRELLERHEHTYGFEVLDYGTPTNNTATVASGYNSEEEYEAVDSFDYAVRSVDLNVGDVFAELSPPARYEAASAQAVFAAAFTQLRDRAAGYGEKYANHATTLGRALGLATADFAYTKNASSGEPLLVDLIQRAVWFALGGQMLDLLLGDQFDPDDHCWLWGHYSTYVKPTGALPAIRVGDQPYGILPTEKLNWDERSVPDREDEREQILRNLLFKLQGDWSAVAEAAPTGSLQPTHLPRKRREPLSNTELYRIMTMLPMSELYQVGLYGLPKITHKVRRFRQEQQQLPVDLSSLTISQVYQLFREGNAFQAERAALEAFIDELRELGQKNPADSDKSILSEALLQRLRDSPIGAFAPLRPYPLREEIGPGETPNPYDGKLTVDLIPAKEDWFYGAFFDFTCQINEVETPGSSAAEGIHRIFAETPSVLTDWLDRSYRNARRLYQRTVRLSFGTEDLRRMLGYQQLIVHRIEVDSGTEVAKGTTVLTLRAQGETAAEADPIFQVSAPFAGQITLADELQEGSVLSALGIPLFTIQNAEKQAAHREQLDSLYAAIVMACAKITDPEERNRQLRRAVNSAYDVNSFRLDAWISSLANRQLAAMRQRKPAGLYYGAYGYVEDLQFSIDDYLPDVSSATDRNHARGGIVHAPSSAQAVTAAIMKNAFDHQLARNEPENPFTLKLTSERIQQGLQILEGMRNELEIEALLGYRLERYLHEHPGEEDLHIAIYQLRRLFPLEVNLLELGNAEVPHSRLAVINGLALLNQLSENPDVKKRKDAFVDRLGRSAKKIAPRIAEIIFSYLLRIEDALDGTLDILFYEAGYQITNGNMARAAAAMDAYKGSGDPPEIQSLTTRLGGKSITHRLALVLPEGAQPAVECSRAFAAPRLEAWLAQELGPLSDIGAAVEWQETAAGPAASLAITLADTGLTHSDLFYGCNEPVQDGLGTLEARIIYSVRAQIPATHTGVIIRGAEAPVGKRPLSDVLEICRYAYRMINKSDGLSSADLQTAAEVVSYPWEELRAVYRNQILPLVARLVPDAADRSVLGPAADLPSWVDRLEDREAIECCANFAFAEAQKIWLPNTPVDVSVLRGEIAETMTEVLSELAEFVAQLPSYEAADEYRIAGGHLTKVAKKLFGADFQLFLPARLSPLVAATLSRPEDQPLLVGTADPAGTQLWGQERIREWLQGVAQVNPQAQAWEDWELVSQSWGAKPASPPEQYWVVQETTGLDYPWVGLSEKEIKQLLAAYPDRLVPLPDGAIYPAATDSLVLYGAGDGEWSAGQAVFGVLLDTFEEQIPDRTTTTGIAFEYDAPNTEAPQSLLLVTPWPGIRAETAVEQGKTWNPEDLHEAVLQTMELAKIRLVDLENLAQHGAILPFAQWLNTPKT